MIQNRVLNPCSWIQANQVWIPLFLLLTLSCAAQTVRPLIDENVLKSADRAARGRIEYINDSLQPLTVTLDVRSFSVSDTGEVSYLPLDRGIRLKLSAMSFRLMPKQVYAVWYEASAEELPVWFVVYATFSGFRERTQQGFRIQVQLPHTIYLLPKKPIQKDELAIVASEYFAKDKRVVVRIRNTGSTLARVLETEVSGKRVQLENSGFPLFPQAERQVEVPWTANAPPEKVRLHLEHFTLEGFVEQAASITP